MSRVYTVRFDAAAITAQTDLFEIQPADDKPVRILGLVLGQTSDVGDANSENLAIKIVRLVTATSGSGGATPTPLPLDPNDVAASFAAEVANSSLASSGSGEAILFSDVWNTQAGYQMWFPEGVQPQAKQGDFINVRTYGAPADSITVHGTLFVQEL